MNLVNKLMNETLSEEDLQPLENKLVENVSKLISEHYGVELDDINEPVNDRDVDFFDELDETIRDTVEEAFAKYL